MKVENELVSVVIITYNSSSTILETLESFKSQTYPNIELIVTDDCSPDNTVQIVREWLKENSKRFSRTLLLENQQNIGPSGNINRGVKAATGVWLKSLAGDDTVSPDSISTYVRYGHAHPEFPIFTAKMKAFRPDGEDCEQSQKCLEWQYAQLKVDSKEQQYHNALKNHILAGPGVFMRREFCDEIGRYNEAYSMVEEYDFELRVFSKVYVPLIEEYLVNWRISPNSLSHKKSLKSAKSDYKFFREVKSKLLLQNKMYLTYYQDTLDFFVALHPKYNWILRYLKFCKPAFWKCILLKLL